MGTPGFAELLIIGLICLAAIAIPAIIIAVILISRKSSTREQYGRIKCPECAESIAAEAVKCRFCGARLDGEAGEQAADESEVDSSTN